MKIDHTQPMTAQSTRFASAKGDVLETISAAPTVESSTGLSPEAVKALSVAESTTVVQQVNEAFKLSGSTFQFKLDQDAGKMVVYLKDEQTGETLRQIPDETVLRISKNIGQYLDHVKLAATPKEAANILTGLTTDTKV